MKILATTKQELISLLERTMLTQNMNLDIVGDILSVHDFSADLESDCVVFSLQLPKVAIEDEHGNVSFVNPEEVVQ